MKYNGKSCKKCGGKMQDGGRRHGYMQSAFNQVVTTPNPQNTPLTDEHGISYEKTKGLAPALMDTGLLMDRFSNIASYLSGIADRKRQNQYDYQQQALLGQMNAQPVDDYQPNPYSLYAKYGGKLKHYMSPDWRKFSNNAHMGDGDETMHGEMQGGGLTRQGSYGSASHPYPSVSAGDFAGPHRSYPIPTHADAVDALRLAHLHGNQAVINAVKAKYHDLQQGGQFNYQFAQDFAARHNMPSNTNLHTVGNPQFVDANGQPYQAPPSKALPYSLPNDVQVSDVYQTSGGQYGYDNPTTGDFTAVDPSVFNSSRYRKQQAPITNLDYGIASPISAEKMITAPPINTALAQKPSYAALKEGGKWLQGAINPAHKGWCTPLSKSTCTGRRRQFALMMKKKHGFN